jgi:hypothetical protein
MKKLSLKLPKAKGNEKLDKIYKRFKAIAATKKIVNDDELETIVKTIAEEE